MAWVHGVSGAHACLVVAIPTVLLASVLRERWAWLCQHLTTMHGCVYVSTLVLLGLPATGCGFESLNVHMGFHMR